MPVCSGKVSRDQYVYHPKEKAVKPPTRLSPFLDCTPVSTQLQSCVCFGLSCSLCQRRNSLKVAQLSISSCGKLRLKQALSEDLHGLVFITAIPPFIMNTLEKKAFLKVRPITSSFVSAFEDKWPWGEPETRNQFFSIVILMALNSWGLSFRMVTMVTRILPWQILGRRSS